MGNALQKSSRNKLDDSLPGSRKPSVHSSRRVSGTKGKTRSALSRAEKYLQELNESCDSGDIFYRSLQNLEQNDKELGTILLNLERMDNCGTLESKRFDLINSAKYYKNRLNSIRRSHIGNSLQKLNSQNESKHKSSSSNQTRDKSGNYFYEKSDKRVRRINAKLSSILEILSKKKNVTEEEKESVVTELIQQAGELDNIRICDQNVNKMKFSCRQKIESIENVLQEKLNKTDATDYLKVVNEIMARESSEFNAQNASRESLEKKEKKRQSRELPSEINETTNKEDYLQQSEKFAEIKRQISKINEWINSLDCIDTAHKEATNSELDHLAKVLSDFRLDRQKDIEKRDRYLEGIGQVKKKLDFLPLESQIDIKNTQLEKTLLSNGSNSIDSKTNELEHIRMLQSTTQLCQNVIQYLKNIFIKNVSSDIQVEDISANIETIYKNFHILLAEAKININEDSNQHTSKVTNNVGANNEIKPEKEIKKNKQYTRVHSQENITELSKKNISPRRQSDLQINILKEDFSKNLISTRNIDLSQIEKYEDGYTDSKVQTVSVRNIDLSQIPRNSDSSLNNGHYIKTDMKDVNKDIKIEDKLLNGDTKLVTNKKSIVSRNIKQDNSEILDQLKIIGDNMEILKEDISSFMGIKSDYEYNLLDEGLVNIMISLDKLEIGNDHSLDLIKNSIINDVYSYSSILEKKNLDCEYLNSLDKEIQFVEEEIGKTKFLNDVENIQNISSDIDDMIAELQERVVDKLLEERKDTYIQTLKYFKTLLLY